MDWLLLDTFGRYESSSTLHTPSWTFATSIDDLKCIAQPISICWSMLVALKKRTKYHGSLSISRIHYRNRSLLRNGELCCIGTKFRLDLLFTCPRWAKKGWPCKWNAQARLEGWPLLKAMTFKSFRWTQKRAQPIDFRTLYFCSQFSNNTIFRLHISIATERKSSSLPRFVQQSQPGLQRVHSSNKLEQDWICRPFRIH